MPISVADRLAIHELISMHGHLADDGRPEDLADVMTADGTYDVTDYGLGVVTGIDALIDLFRAAPGAQPPAPRASRDECDRGRRRDVR